MRFSTIAVAVFATAAQAASTIQTSQGTATSSLSAPQSSVDACIKACDVDDVNCKAHCIAVPSPDKNQAEATTQCVKKCPQGDGSKSETDAYAACINQCISQNYYVTSSGTPQPTGASGSGSGSGSSGSGSSDSSSSGSDSGSDSASATGSDSDSSSGSSDDSAKATGTQSDSASQSGTATGNASSPTKTGAASALIASSGALFGLAAAIFAL